MYIMYVDREHVVDILPHLWVLDARMITGKKLAHLVQSQIKRLYAFTCVFGLFMHTHESYEGLFSTITQFKAQSGYPNHAGPPCQARVPI